MASSARCGVSSWSLLASSSRVAMVASISDNLAFAHSMAAWAPGGSACACTSTGAEGAAGAVAGGDSASATEGRIKLTVVAANFKNIQASSRASALRLQNSSRHFNELRDARRADRRLVYFDAERRQCV